MKRKLDTRFPAARIKKIMQADEDVGKIAMAVPLLVSKALELFLHDLCDQTYKITLQRGAKTLNSSHLKQCVQSFNLFDFLREIVGKIPDLGGSDAAGDNRSTTKRRKVADDDNNDCDDESKRARQQETVQSNGGGRGRGWGRGRGRGRTSRAEREITKTAVSSYEKHDGDAKISQHSVSDMLKQNLNSPEDVDSKENRLAAPAKTDDSVPVRNFDLNLDLHENGDTPAISAAHVIHASTSAESQSILAAHVIHASSSAESQSISAAPVTSGGSSAKLTLEMKPEEYPGWSLVDVKKMAVDPVQLANLNSRLYEEEEDYDEE